MIDFTNCPRDRGIIYNGERYILKSPSNVYSEKVACDILNALGFNAQSVLLGTYEGEPVVACKNFIPKGAVFATFRTVAVTSLPTVSDISKALTDEMIESFWDMFILDAFLGNPDRNVDSWGYLKLKGSSSFVPAPIYNCESCLYPDVKDSEAQSIVFNTDRVKEMVDLSPTAALMRDNCERVNYKEFIGSLSNQDCTAALLRVVPKINLDTVTKVISNSDFLTDTRKFFYAAMLGIRYERILKPAYEKARASTYTLGDMMLDPSTLMQVMDKHWDYAAWFDRNFPNGAPSKEAVLNKLKSEV